MGFSIASSSFEGLKRKRLLNPYYFIGLTGIILCLHWAHVFLKFSASNPLTFQFAFVALIESILEGTILCLIGSFLTGKKKSFQIFMVISAWVPVIHLIDYVLERLFNLGFWKVLFSFCYEKVENLGEYLYATNLPLWVWAVGFLAIGMIAALFYGAYRLSAFVSEKWPLKVTVHTLGLALLGLAFLYIPLKLGLYFPISLNNGFVKALPFKGFFSHSFPTVNRFYIQPTQEKPALNYPVQIGKDLYIFIIESLRDDSVNSMTAPHMTQLGDEGYRHKTCYASGNGTQLSWYSIFFGEPSLYWRHPPSIGSPYLADLKNQGYLIHVLSSARLSYYGMDTLLFGQKHALIESLFCPKLTEDMSAYDADKLCLEKLKNITASSSQDKRAFIIFLDATHFGYSLPEKKSSHFTPYVEAIPYLDILFTHVNIQAIKNRYYNAIHAVDALIGEVFSHLKQTEQWDESTILLTGDHGEEFLDKGQIFHASHLSHSQLKIPCIFKAPQAYRETIQFQATLSHEQMFPLIKTVMAGHPFQDRAWQQASRYLFARTPQEVVFMDQNVKALCLYHEKANSFDFKGLFNTEDEPIDQELPHWLQTLLLGQKNETP